MDESKILIAVNFLFILVLFIFSTLLTPNYTDKLSTITKIIDVSKEIIETI